MVLARTTHPSLSRRLARRVDGWPPCLALALLLTLLTGTTLLIRPALATSADGAWSSYAAATGHNISGQVKQFYDQHGGLAVFGLPLTERFSQGAIEVQYFERARFEIRAERISLSRVASALTRIREETAFAWLSQSPVPERTFYAQSGHTLGGAFGDFWRRRGGVAIFGYPISEEFVEDGVLVQYFERVRLEYRPDNPKAPVQIGLLGRSYAQLMGVTAEQLAPAPQIKSLGQARMAIPAAAAQNVGRAAARIDGQMIAPGATFSFLDVLGEVSRATGYQPGQAIVNNQVVTSIGGGICYVSTVLYRAIFQGGFAVLERHPHSLALAAFSDQPGFDAAVDTSGVDLRWRNDTGQPVVVVARLSGGALTVTLWGQGDGRTTTVRGPSVSQDGDVLVASISRVVRAANGAALARQTVLSRYIIPRPPMPVPAPGARPTLTPQ